MPTNKREIMAERSESGAPDRALDRPRRGWRRRGASAAPRRSTCGIRPIAARSTCASPPTATWHYCGSPIGRAALVNLFASILRKDAERYVLVTPVERVGIRVDDAPFLCVEMGVEAEGEDGD